MAAAIQLGENSLAVSRYSRHVDEAMALVRYLSRRDVQIARTRTIAMPPTIPDLYDDPEVLSANPYYAQLKEVLLGGALSRPSSVSGGKYAAVSRAYFRAVHSVLTRQQKAETAAATLQREIEWITGFSRRCSAVSASGTGGIVISRRPKSAASSEKAPGPRRAMAVATRTTSSGVRPTSNAFGVGDGSHESDKPAPLRAASTPARGVMSPSSSKAPFRAVTTPTARIPNVG
jgi:hypothetical protein